MWQDLVTESGAYRFSSNGATPLLTALIQTGLELPWVVYDSSHNKIVRRCRNQRIRPQFPRKSRISTENTMVVQG